MIADTEAALGEFGEIFQRVGRDAVDVRVGAHGDRGAERVLLNGSELARPAGLGAVVEAGKPFGVVASDGIAERLALDADDARGLREDHPFHRIGDGEHAPRRPGNGLAAREPPQVARLVQIGADCSPRCHRALRIIDRLALHESQRGAAVNPESQFMCSTV